MAGIYLHIPFCLSKCAYCGFYSVPSMKRKAEVLEALKQEMVSRKDYLHGETIGTIYFGGGTPSLLILDEIKVLQDLIKEHYRVEPDAEITLEANPDTLSMEYLQGLRALGVNRLSIGIQSFFDNDLKYLSRRHNSEHAIQCLQWAKEAGFDNLNIDLIYGLPTSDADQWKRNLDRFLELDLPHLSAYALTLEPNAILTKLIEQGKAAPLNEDDAVRDYGILCQKMAQAGYLHYEISNFCRPGWTSRHNTSYWFGVPYLGLGPSAHSFDGKSRQWNSEFELLSPEQRYDEYVMLRLRTMWGIDLKYMRSEMGEHFYDYCLRQAEPLIAQKRLSRIGDSLYLTDEQMLFADGIAEELFWA
ncbi:MAG: radical SAM family heme chaperone HemW [Bacteroidales bacterium]|nr:radical SAM family heme chaperone HemW [Bacteroidales bacterium]